ncbi:DNA-processing protein DprA [Microbacterium gilvum]|uniref:DNA-processing protein DprA n=1 Tax=Microbacterium gilvum TaxID=1336204 RepID=A0ABP8ZS52_9MICO
MILSERRVRSAAARVQGATGDEQLARLIWSVVVEPGDGVAGALVAAFGAEEALRLAEEGLADPAVVRAGLDGRSIAAARARWEPRLDGALATAAAVRAAKAGLVLRTPGDDDWPSQLDDLGPHAPLALWVRGEPDALGLLDADRTWSAAIVGARAATPYGEHVAAELAAELSAEGVAIVSGAAYGIDGAAHRAALGAGGLTVAVVAGGADLVYPAGHARLFAEIARAGAVVSETPPGTTPTKWRFLARNRLIAALGGATVVVEAGARSGTLNTAGHAASLGRPLGAVPGPITSTTSSGCHRLLREFDAQCITGAGDVLEMLGAGPRTVTRPADPSPEEVRVRDALASRGARALDEIVRRSGLAPRDAQAALGLLELAGTVRRAEGGWLLA